MSNAVARKKISELSETDYFKMQNAVVDLKLKQVSETDIAKQLKLDRASVVTMIEEWKEYVRSDKSFKEMGRERLHEMDRHYGLIISELWDSHDSLKDEGKYKEAAAAAKIISEVEAKRQDALQKAGMYDDGELTDMIIENERKTEAITVLLTEIITDHPELRDRIVTGLRKIEDPNYVEPVEVLKGEQWKAKQVDG